MSFKIGLVARCLNTAHVRGMGRYLFELIQNSNTNQDAEWFLFGNDPDQPMTVPLDTNVQVDIFDFRGDRFHFWEQIGLPLRVLKHNVDVLHCTESTLPLWQPKPTVVTIHDTLMWEDALEGYVSKFYFNKLLPAAMKRCAAIVTISESSKNDVLKKWPWLESKLTVIPHGISGEYFIDVQPDLPSSIRSKISDTPYIVYLGGPMERKRFSWALEVFAHCKQKPLKLIACGFGATARSEAIRNLPPELRDDVNFPDFLSDADLLALYKNAKAVLYPTLYEGFGFPALEAQAAGVPVLFSALGSLAELIGPLAMVLPPYDLEAWIKALDDAFTLDEERIEKEKAAKKWAQQFSWKESAEKHLSVYRKVKKV
jgi:glycosyltransferase involved in cell wall biosynthesis